MHHLTGGHLRSHRIYRTRKAESANVEFLESRVLFAAPRVEAVFLDSTAWTQAFRDYNNMPYGYAVPAGASQLTTLPWNNLNRITIRFNEPVTVAQDDLLVRGVNTANYAVTSFTTYNPNDPSADPNVPDLQKRTSSWTLSANIAKDKLLIHLRNTLYDNDADLNELDGDWTDGTSAFPSGNGVSGGLFQFRANVLPGDATRNSLVDASDEMAERDRGGTSTTTPVVNGYTYGPNYDLDGNGKIDAIDLVIARNQYQATLPAAEPSRPTLPAAPSGLTGSIPFGNISDDTWFSYLDASWTDRASDEAGFQIERSVDGSSRWTKVTTRAALGTSTDTGLRVSAQSTTVNQKFYYRVRAFNAAGASDPSDPNANVIWPAFAADDAAAKVSVTMLSSPTGIRLSWPKWNDTAVQIYRKESTWNTDGTLTPWPTTPLATVNPGTYFFDDFNVTSGSYYEYKVTRPSLTYVPAVSYVSAGIEMGKTAPSFENRGSIVLIVESGLADPSRPDNLINEIQTLRNDLAADGWKVIYDNDCNVPRHVPSEVNPALYDAGVKAVKHKIQTEYDRPGANVKGVLLLGHVPVPYSGGAKLTPQSDNGSSPDGHGGRALPADVFYGDVVGTSAFPTDADRWKDEVDFLPVFDQNTGHLRDYQDPGFPGEFEVGRNDNVHGDGKYDAVNLKDGRAPELMVGRVDLANLATFNNPTYTSTPLPEYELLRRYLAKDHAFRQGQWDVPRRALSDTNLGVPTAGSFRDLSSLVGPSNVQGLDYFDTLKTRGKAYLWTYGEGFGRPWRARGVGSIYDFANGRVLGVFNSFFGSYFGDWDHTENFLRAAIAADGYGLTAMYSSPTGYHQHMTLGEPIGYSERVAQNDGVLPAPPPSPNNPNPQPPPPVYDGDAGVGFYQTLMGDPTLRMHPVKPARNLHVTTASAGPLLTWSLSDDTNIVGYYAYGANSPDGPFVRLPNQTQPALTNHYQHTTAFTSEKPYSNYMVRAVKLEQSAGGSYYNASEGVSEPYMSYVGTDDATQGSWGGVYGADGYTVAGGTQIAPTYGSATVTGAASYVWSESDSDPRDLQKSSGSSDRVAATWYAAGSFDINVRTSDQLTHKVSIYMVDWDYFGRQQRVQVLDLLGNVLDSRDVSGFSGGRYLSWNVRGDVTIRITNLNPSANAVVSGVFFR